MAVDPRPDRLEYIRSQYPSVAVSRDIGAVLNNNITSYLQTGEIIDTRVNALNSDLADAKTQAKNLQAYANQLTDQYNAQFTALNTLMAQMQNNSQYLTQLFGGTNSAGALATNK